MSASLDYEPEQTAFWQRIHGRIVLVLLVLLIPTLLIQGYVFYSWYQERRQVELEANTEMARAVAMAFESFVNNVFQQEYALGLALTIPNISVETQKQLIEKNMAEYPSFFNLLWVSPEGVVLLAYQRETEGVNINDRESIEDIVSGQDRAVGNLVQSKTTGLPIISMARGIRDKKGELLGIVVASILAERLDEVLAIKRPEGAGLALVDNKGMLVYRHPSIHPTWEQRNWLKDYPEFGEALKGKEFSETYFSLREGKKRLVGVTPVPSIGWIATAGSTEEIVMKPVVSRLIPQVLLLLAVASAAFIAALLLSRFIASPVTQLRNHAIALGSGELREPLVAAGPFELKQLTHSFNEMADKLRSREKSLREQREWLNVTLTSVGDAVMATDTEGKITFINPVAAALTGWPMREVLEKPVEEVFRTIDERTREAGEDIVKRVLREQCVVALANHTALITRDGREVPIEDSAAPIRDDAGNVSGVVVVFHDVTERRRVQNALRESEERLRLFIEHAPASLAMFDREMRYLSFSRRWVDDYKLGELALRGMSHYEIFPEISEHWKEVHRRGLEGEVVCTEEDRFVRADGSIQWLQWEVRPWHEAAGNVGGIVIFTEDITERKNLAEEIESVARFPDENPNPILRVSKEGELLYANRSSASLLESLCQGSQKTIPAPWRQNALEALNSGLVLNIEVECKGTVYSFLFVPIRHLEYVNIYGRDITALKRMEEELRRSRDELEIRVHERTAELERSNQALREFASIASHDMKEPLRKVVSFGNILQRQFKDSLGQTGNEYLNRMVDATQRMQTMITSLLEYSKLTVNAEPFSEVDLYDIVHEVLSDLEINIEKTGGEVKIEELPSIEADPAQMRRLFQNLIGNALKFRKDGEVPRVRIWSTSTERGTQLFIEDNGIGFEEQYLDSIFQLFHRLHGRSGPYEGTGMGLAICKKIVERHGGSITARSSPGIGSSFMVQLPLKQSHVGMPSRHSGVN